MIGFVSTPRVTPIEKLFNSRSKRHFQVLNTNVDETFEFFPIKELKILLSCDYKYQVLPHQ